MKIVYLFAIVLFLLVACEKDDRNDVIFSYPSKYHSTYLKSVSNVRLFTQKGEITDKQVIEKYLSKHGRDYLSLGERKSIEPSDTVRILSENIAEISWSGYAVEYIFKQKGRELQFIDKDTSIVTGYFYFNKLHRALLKWQPVYEKQTVLPSASGKTSYAEVVEVIRAKTVNDLLEFPFMQYIKTWNNNSISTVTVGNWYSESGYQYLDSGDTLSLQEFVRVFEK